MNIKKLYSIFLFLIIPFMFFINVKDNIKTNELSSILNNDNNLGIFRDLTKEEIKTYYNTIEIGTKGDELLSSLQKILKEGQIKLKYESGSTSSTNWDGYYLLDRDWEKSPLTTEEIASQKYNKTDIWMNILYSTPSIYIEDSINSGTFGYYLEDNYNTIKYKNGSTQFDREHVFPKSFGFNGDNNRYKSLTAGCDMQNLHAGEHNGNSAGHNNLPYGNVVIKDSTTEIKSGITGEIIGYTGNNSAGIKVFEPLDEDKGDIARTLFYMCARYHTYEELGDGDNTPALSLADNVSTVSTKDPEDTKDSPFPYGQLSDLLNWHELDPVDEFEIHRNNLCYNAIQHNRNPFIDYPEWVEIAFTDSSIGVNLNNDNGVDNQNNFIVNSNTNTIYKYETINVSNLSITLNDTNILFSDLTYKVKLNNEKVEVSNLENYVFDKIGRYEITFNYYNSIDTINYESIYILNVISPYTIKVNNEADLSFVMGDKLDKSKLNILKYNKDNLENEITDYTITIIDNNGSKIDFNNTYEFKKMGKYTIIISSVIDGDIVETSIDVNVSLPILYKIIIIVALLVILLIVLIIFISINKKKKSKKRRKK